MFYRLIAAVIGFLLPSATYAAEGYRITNIWNCHGFLFCGSPDNAVAVITGTIVSGVTAFISALAIVVFFYGAIRMVVSQGQEGKEAGKKALIWASFGLAAALLTGAVVEFVSGYIYFLAS